MSLRRWIVWLMLALLPLRSVAVVAMQDAPTRPAAVHAAGSEVMPCHDNDDASASAANAGHACHLCDLCHSALATAPAARLASAMLPAPPLTPKASPDTGRQLPGGLERPPRGSAR